MSQTNDITISSDHLLEVAKLAKLKLSDASAERHAKAISKILGMMQTLSNIDTDGIEPLTNIHTACQTLRPDDIDNNINRQENQSCAPSVSDGLYLVPQVIE